MTNQGRHSNTEALLLWHRFGYLTSYLLAEFSWSYQLTLGVGFLRVYMHVQVPVYGI